MGRYSIKISQYWCEVYRLDYKLHFLIDYYISFPNLNNEGLWSREGGGSEKKGGLEKK